MSPFFGLCSVWVGGPWGREILGCPSLPQQHQKAKPPPQDYRGPPKLGGWDVLGGNEGVIPSPKSTLCPINKRWEGHPGSVRH